MINQRRFFAKLFIVLTTSLATGWLFAEQLHADSCCKSGGNTISRNDDRQQQQTHRVTEPVLPSRAPHGGQLAKTTWNYFEVVYGPQETRIYAYDMYRFPKSARAIQGQVCMRVRSNGGEYRYPIQYVPVEHGHDYLAVRVDLTRVRDGDMDGHIDLIGLPNGDAPTARFANVFARPAPGETMHVVGRPPAVDGHVTQPLRTNVQYGAPQITVTQATAADNAAIRAQGVCPVMNQQLGSHGRPTKVVIGGRPVFVCCEGCVGKVQENPGRYLAQARG